MNDLPNCPTCSTDIFVHKAGPRQGITPKREHGQPYICEFCEHLFGGIYGEGKPARPHGVDT